MIHHTNKDYLDYLPNDNLKVMLSNVYRRMQVIVVFPSALTTTGGSAGYDVYHIIIITYDLDAGFILF